MSATRDLEARADQLAGAIYGTIVVAGLLAATGPDDDPEIWPTALWILVTAVASERDVDTAMALLGGVRLLSRRSM